MTNIKHSLSLKPIAGYTRLYLHNYKTPWGEERSEILHGSIESDISKLPGYLEYDNAAHKYLGIGMITIVPVEDAKRQKIDTQEYLYSNTDSRDA